MVAYGAAVQFRGRREDGEASRLSPTTPNEHSQTRRDERFWNRPGNAGSTGLGIGLGLVIRLVYRLSERL
jgi:hypothetical protein